MKGDHDDGVIRDELLRQLREAFKDMVFKPPIRKNKMKGDQAIELTDPEGALSAALDFHFTDDNCDGVLMYIGYYSDDLIHKTHQFVCKKCSMVIQIE